MSNYKDLTQIANYEFFTDSKAFQYTSNQTNTVLLTPSTGKRLRIHDISVNTVGTTGLVEIEFKDTGYVFYRFNATAASTNDHTPMREVGNTDESIRLTSTTGSNNLNIHINYAEVVDNVGSVQSETSTSTSTTTTSTSSTTTSTSSTTTSTSSTTTSTSSTTTSTSSTTTTSTSSSSTTTTS